ncbi:MAG: hypothetical protein JW904_02840 [Spirochaetales bacterium]|nr:hypothetical protein [Spirochaetales bacterium]
MKRIISITAVLCFLLGACVTTSPPAGADFKTGPMPGWVSNPPQDDDSFMYFTGSGQSGLGVLSEAEQFAVQDIISNIVKFIGVEITARTSAQAKGTLENFQTNISREVSESSSSRVSGFRVQEKWFQKNEKGILVYILVRYEKEALLKEKARIEQLFVEKLEAITIPEAKARELEAAGRHYEAMLRYLDASAAAAESTLENAGIYFSRNIDNAMKSLEKISVFKLNDNLSGTIGQEFAQPFGLKIVSGNTVQSAGIPNADVMVSFPEVKNGKQTMKYVVVRSDADGVVTFKHPIPTFVGAARVTMVIDISPYLKKLKASLTVPTEKITAIDNLAATKKQVFVYSVASRAKNIPTAIFVVDCDESGKSLSINNSTTSGIAETLTAEGFSLKNTRLDPAVLLGKTDKDAVGIIRQGTSGLTRAVIGNAAVDSYYLDGTRYILKVRGTVKVLDLVTGELLYEKTLTKSVTGVNLESTRLTAFKQLGKELGQKISIESP